MGSAGRGNCGGEIGSRGRVAESAAVCGVGVQVLVGMQGLPMLAKSGAWRA
jgi:hypothetical protein